MCPFCRTNAPLVYRGLRATCAGCGAQRAVLSGSSLTHAGKPTSIGGSVVKAFGWLTLVGGLFLATICGLIVGLVGTAGGGVIAGLVLSALALFVFLLLRTGGNKLEESGKEARDASRQQALFALAYNRGGRLQAMDAATALDLSESEADAFLTQLAKQRPDLVGVDIGEQGELFYTFQRAQTSTSFGGPWGAQGGTGGGGGWRAPGPRAGTRVRIDAPHLWTASQPSPTGVDPRVVDAELEEIEEAEREPRRRRR